jgi:hypothetical protein
MGLRRQYIGHLANMRSRAQLHDVQLSIDTNAFDQFPDPARKYDVKTLKRYICNSGNSPQKLQIKSTMLQIVLLLFPENLTQSRGLSPRLSAFIFLRPGPKPSQAVARARLSSAK